MNRTASLIAVTAVVLFAGLTACAKQVEAPADAGVCWHAAKLPDGTLKFNKLAEHVPNLESCAAQLEAMRLRFEGLGVSQGIVTGAYQGQFLFLGSDGVFTSQTLTGGRYLFLVRTGDGRLAKASAMPQP